MTRKIAFPLTHTLSSTTFSQKKYGYENKSNRKNGIVPHVYFSGKQVLAKDNSLFWGEHEVTYCCLPDEMDIVISQTFVRGSLNKFTDFFRMGTFIDSTLMKL